MTLIDKINALLPQTQCGECQFPGCKPYAMAIAAGQAQIDRCPPGGVKVLEALGQLLTIDTTPYLSAVKENTRQPSVALIREDECIGCTKCIQACPVDAIIGTGKQMHTVILHECTGCGLCVEPCPVDCIDILPLEMPLFNKSRASSRFNAKSVREIRERQDKELSYQERKQLADNNQDKQQDIKAKQDYILKALERARRKQHG